MERIQKETIDVEKKTRKEKQSYLIPAPRTNTTLLLKLRQRENAPLVSRNMEEIKISHPL